MACIRTGESAQSFCDRETGGFGDGVPLSQRFVVVVGFVAALTVRLGGAWTVACLVYTFRRLIVVVEHRERAAVKLVQLCFQ